MSIKQKKGISLIVLVITIIVMIILATAIILSLNSAGIIGKANKAVEDTDFKQLVTAANVGYSEALLNGYTTKADIESQVRSYLLSNGYTEEYLSNYKIELGDKGIEITKSTVEKVTNPYTDKQWEFAYAYSADTGWSQEITTGTPTGDIVAKFYKIDEATSAYSLVIEGKGEMGAIVDLNTGNMNAWITKVASNGLNITEAIVCDGVEHIGDYALAMTNVSNMQIASTVTSIGVGAFLDCESLASIELPNNITSIEDRAFEGCRSLVTIDLPDLLTSIGKSVFRSCSRLTSIDIPDGVTSIGEYAFQNCTSLESIEWSNNITSIEDGMFSGCRSLVSIDIPDGVTSIGTHAFVGCSSLESIEWSNNIISIGASAFDGCTSLESVDIPDTVTSIGKEAFAGCTNLISIKLSSLLTKTEQATFYCCQNLESIYISDALVNIGEGTFRGCEKLADIYYSGTEEAWGNVTIGSDNTPLTNATIHYESTGLPE